MRGHPWTIHEGYPQRLSHPCMDTCGLSTKDIPRDLVIHAWTIHEGYPQRLSHPCMDTCGLSMKDITRDLVSHAWTPVDYAWRISPETWSSMRGDTRGLSIKDIPRDLVIHVWTPVDYPRRISPETQPSMRGHPWTIHEGYPQRLSHPCVDTRGLSMKYIPRDLVIHAWTPVDYPWRISPEI